MRIGIVGNQLYGQVFTRSVEATSRATAVAICPELSENLEPFATEHHLKPYPDLNSMLRHEKLDAVVVASMTAHHDLDVISCLEAGAHVLVDRPMALSLDACDRMIAAADSAKRILMVGYILEFWPEYVAVRDMVARGELGRPLAVTASRISGGTNPNWEARRLNPAYGLGGLEAHTHDIDLLLNMLGEPETITAQGTFTDDGCPSHIHTLLRFGNGCHAGVEADYRVPFNFPLSMYLRVVGEHSTAVFTFRGGLAARQSARRRLLLFSRGSEVTEVQVPLTDAYANMANHFIDCVEQGKQPQWGNTNQGRQSVGVLLEILRSAQVAQSQLPVH